MIDALGALDTRVESEKAPVASRPLAGEVGRTRPLCSYPQVARYRGQGSTTMQGASPASLRAEP